MLDAALDHAPLVVYAKDGDGRFTVVNTAFERIAGRPRGDILGRRGDELELGVGDRRFSAHDGPEVLEPGGTELFEEVLDACRGCGRRRR